MNLIIIKQIDSLLTFHLTNNQYLLTLLKQTKYFNDIYNFRVESNHYKWKT